jgi:hypothetical protein
LPLEKLGKLEPLLTEVIFSQMMRLRCPPLKPIAYATIMVTPPPPQTVIYVPALGLRQEPSWCLSLQSILAPLSCVIQNDPQPFGADFVPELKNMFIENFMEFLNTTTI